MNIGLDKFKTRALQCLEARNEAPRLYPIEEGDLAYVADCVICGSKSISTLTEVYLASRLKFFSTNVCHDCLYTFRSVSPSYQWFKKCWAMIATKKLEIFNPEIEEIRRERYEKYWELLSKYVKNHSVLDVGAGYGTGSRVFRERGCEVEAIEPEDDRAHYIDKTLNIPIYHTSIEEFSAGTKRYNLIIFSQCLEHLDNPGLAMSKLAGLLDADYGVLYVEIPLVWDIVTWSDALYLTHKSNFTEGNIALLAAKSGFEIVDKIRYQPGAGEPPDLGMVMKPMRSSIRMNTGFRSLKEKFGVEEIRRLYRKHLPLNQIPPLEEVIKYSVPYIDHFYYTLRLHSKRIIEPRGDSGFISFESV